MNPSDPQDEDIHDGMEDDEHPPQQNPPHEGKGGAGAPPGGGSMAGQGSSNDKEMEDGDAEDNNNDEDPEESVEEDPLNSQTGKDYTPKTLKDKEMARMLVSFCRLPKSSANTIVVYSGVSRMDKFADFPEEHWKDTLVL